ncbi:MAG: hypothetical protein AB7V58_18220 [Solirubrobacterales bacterium]
MQWSEVEPVLNATYGLLEENDEVGQDAVCVALGRPAGDQATIRALELLHQGGYIGGPTIDNSPAPVFIEATPKGLEQASGWPGEDGNRQIELLLHLLDERIEAAATPEEKSKVKQARDAFAGLSKDVAVGLLTAYVTQISGASQ